MTVVTIDNLLDSCR